MCLLYLMPIILKIFKIHFYTVTENYMGAAIITFDPFVDDIRAVYHFR